MRDFKRGSASIEAALVIPMLILIIAALIKIGISCENKVKDASFEYRSSGAKISEDTLTNTEDILRGRWYFE